jgi:hypothetical protein
MVECMGKSSDVPARLGLRAPALAWLGAALACNNFGPGHQPKPGPSPGLALAHLRLWHNKSNSITRDFSHDQITLHLNI